MTYGYIAVDAGLTSCVLDNNLTKKSLQNVTAWGGDDDFNYDDGGLSTLCF